MEIKKIKIILLILFLFGGISLSEEIKNREDYSIDFLMGNIKVSSDKRFIKLDEKYAVAGKEVYVYTEVYDKLKLMIESAKEDGIKLKVISGMRTFNYQKSIWERKWKNYKEKNGFSDEECAREILKYSAMPGSSRHHWGTDFDFNSLENSYFDSGEGKKIYSWLLENGHKYGFYQVYKRENLKGYSEEKWHWSYLEIADKMLKQYNEKIDYSCFKGFSGAETSKKLNIIEEYVNGIDRK